MTSQRPERVVYQNVNRDLACCPPLPKLVLMPDAVQEFLRSPPKKGIRPSSTALWRRYIGQWEINDNRLFFRGIELLGLEGHQSLPHPLAADWVTGTLEIPDGDRIEFFHGRFGSVYEREIHIHVELGIVRSTDVLLNRTPEEVVERREMAFNRAREAGQMIGFTAWYSGTSLADLTR